MATVIGNLQVQLGLDSAAFQQGMQDVSKRLRAVGDQMSRLGKQMSAGLTAPIVGFGVLSLRTAAQFEMSMNQVAAVTSATGDDLKALTDQARQLGGTTQFSASQAADAMNFLGMAGMKTEEILAAMPDTLKLASSAQLDMADAADIVTNILAGYSMSVDDLAHANDVLVTAFTSANTDLRQLGEAMKHAGPIAVAAGVSFEEAAAAIAMMGNAGIQGSMAGTSLKGAMTRMLNPTSKAKAIMEDAGLAFTDAHGRLLPLADVIEQLEPHANDAGLMMELFGQRAGPAMAALVSQGSDSVRDLTGDLLDSAGAADRVSSVQMEGLAGAMRALRSAFEDLQLSIAASGLIEWATDFTKWMTALIQRVSQASPEFMRWGVIIAGVVAVVGPLLIGLGLLIKTLGLVAAGFAVVSAPVALAVAAIVGAAAAIVANWETVAPWFRRLFDSLGDIFSGFAGIVNGLLTGDMQQALDGARLAWEGFGKLWETQWDGLVGTITWAWGHIKPVLDALGVTDVIVDAWESLQASLQGVIDAIGAAFDWLLGKIEPVVDALKNVFDFLDRNKRMQAPAGAGGIGAGDIRSIGQDLMDGLAIGTEGIDQIGMDAMREYLDGVRDEAGIQSPSKMMEEVGRFLIDGLEIGIEGGMPQIAAATQSVGEAIEGGLGRYFDRIPRSFDDVRDSFRRMLEDMANQLWRSGLTQLLSSLFGGGGLMSGLGIMIPGFATGVQHFAGGMAMINERGGELAIMPSGSTVIPHDLSKRMVDGQGDAGHVDVRVYVDQDGNWEAAVERIAGPVSAQVVAGYDKALPGRFQQISANPRYR